MHLKVPEELWALCKSPGGALAVNLSTKFHWKLQGGFFTYERCGRGDGGPLIGSHDYRRVEGSFLPIWSPPEEPLWSL